MAYLEGEGDRSLQYWSKFHKQVFDKELTKMKKKFCENMMVVYELFEEV